MDALPLARTKIVATIGPASRSADVLHRLIAAGVSVFRLNFSHGSHEEHAAVVAQIRSASAALGRHVAILQDLCGPKMRLGPIPNDMIDCNLGDEFTLVSEPSGADPRELTCSYRNLPNDLKPGEQVLFADGTVAMTVVATRPGQALLRVTLPGRLRSRQGLNLPGSELTVPSLTPKDLLDLDWTARHAADIQFVGLSFARSPDDVQALRRELQARQVPARIVVKIEKPQAVRHLEAIVQAADAVMVARGDLGVEMEAHRVPAIQKRIIELCNRLHRPVITATQMLNSMESSNRPTRAEASDVFNAVLDGTDAVMLSGETAVGLFPIEAVTTMVQICREAEAFLEARGHPPITSRPRRDGFVDPITEAAVDAAFLLTERLDAPVLALATETGRTALALSNRRPTTSVLAVTPSERVARLLAVCWGVTPLVYPGSASGEQLLDFAMRWAGQQRLVQPGQHVVLLLGPAGEPKSRAILAREVPQPNERHASP